MVFFESKLNEQTAILAEGCEADSIFITDNPSAHVLQKLEICGIMYLVLRSAGFNSVDLNVANQLEISVARVPAYSLYAVTEHGIAKAVIDALKICQIGYFGMDVYEEEEGIFF